MSIIDNKKYIWLKKLFIDKLHEKHSCCLIEEQIRIFVIY